MACLGEGVGRLLPALPARSTPTGSTCSAASPASSRFTALSFLDAPPLGWGLIAAAGFVALHGAARPAAARGGAWSRSSVAARRRVAGRRRQLVAVLQDPRPRTQPGRAQRIVGQRHPAPDDPRHRASTAGWAACGTAALRAHAPATALRHVLIVGAGNGNDVAVALAHGRQVRRRGRDRPAASPQIGRRLHPEPALPGPARARRTSTTGAPSCERTDDAATTSSCSRCPDSLTLVSGQRARCGWRATCSRARRSPRRASHLAPGGAFAMYNYYREQWLIDRLRPDT